MGSGTNQTNPRSETGWVSAPVFAIFTAFGVTPSTMGTNDYAGFDVAVGTFSSNPIGTAGAHMGILALSDSQVRDTTVWNGGYPQRSNCPAGAIIGGPVDCPNGTIEIQGTPPYSWGELMWTTQGRVAPRTSTVWRSKVDITGGHSGGPLVLFWSFGCIGGECSPGFYVIGTASTATTSTNLFNRVTTAVLGLL